MHNKVKHLTHNNTSSNIQLPKKKNTHKHVFTLTDTHTHTHSTGSVASHSYRIHLHEHPRLTCQLNNSYVLYTEVTNHNRCESQDNTLSRKHNKPKRSHSLPTSVQTARFHPQAFVNCLKKKFIFAGFHFLFAPLSTMNDTLIGPRGRL